MPWSERSPPLPTRVQGPAGAKRYSPKMGLIVTGGRSMAQNQEGGDTWRGTQTGARIQAIQRGACHGMGRKTRPGKPQGLPRHIALVGGPPWFLWWAPQTLTSAPGPGHSQGGLRQRGAAHTPPSMGRPGCIRSWQTPWKEGLGWLGTSVKTRICLSVRPAQLGPSTHLAEWGSRRLHAVHVSSCPHRPVAKANSTHLLPASVSLSCGRPLGEEKRRPTQSLPSVLVPVEG